MYTKPATKKSLRLSPLAEACWRVDLSSIHELLEKLGYGEDDAAVTNEVLYYIFVRNIIFFAMFKKSLDGN